MTSKMKNKKTAQASKMTAAWVDSMPITISDDDDDDDVNEADKQLAAVSATTGQPSDAIVPQTSDAERPLKVEFTVGTSSDQLHAETPSHATSLSVNADAEKCLVGMLAAAATATTSVAPDHVPANTDNLTTPVSDSHTTESVNAEKTSSAACVPADDTDGGMFSYSFCLVTSKICSFFVRHCYQNWGAWFKTKPAS